ncbi:MAG: hypothetical protein JXQ87_13785 [Bacteroidia bacterium]
MFAKEVIQLNETDSFLGVYKIGVEPFTLTRKPFYKKPSLFRYQVEFLLKGVNQSFLVEEKADLFNVVVNDNFGYLIFESDSENFIFRIEADQKPMRFDISSKQNLLRSRIIDAQINTLGDITLVRDIAFEEDFRTVNAFEIEIYSAEGKMLLSSLDEYKSDSDKIYKSLHTSPNGVLLLFDIGENSRYRFYILKQLVYASKDIYTFNLGRTIKVGNLLVEPYPKGWIVCFSNLIGPSWNLYSEGLSLYHFDHKLKLVTKNIISTQKFKDSINQSRVRKHPLGRSINNFIYNQELDILFTNLKVTENGIEILGESFNFGPGVTYTELSMGIRDTLETVLSIYEQLVFEYDINGVFLEGRILKGEMINILLDRVVTRAHPLKDYELAEECLELNLFKTKFIDGQCIISIKYQKLDPYLEQYYFESEQSVLSKKVDFGYPCESPTYIDTMLKSGDFPFLKKVHDFTYEVDSIYERFYEQSEPTAYKITDLNAMYPPDEREAFSYLALNNYLFLVYRHEWTCNQIEFDLIRFN